MTMPKNDAVVQRAAAHFGSGDTDIESLGEGLIHNTYKVRFSQSEPVVLQCINQVTFAKPENIINNYKRIQDALTGQKGITIPQLIKTLEGQSSWIAPDGGFWRATQFIPNSFGSTFADDPAKVYAAARCFAGFTHALGEMDTRLFDVIIPHFHDLDYRYQQFEEAVRMASVNRLLKATHILSELRNRQSLVELFRSMVANPLDYPTRLMHHDCKMSNILFDKTTQQVLCPVDLDTVMPGKFFSDVGDMIRTMTCRVDENSTDWELVDIKEEYYSALVKGYQEGMQNSLTVAEKNKIPQSGMMLTFMQSLRFVTDFLNGDIYYRTTYPEQNLNRALNQLLLLEKLEAFSD